MYDVIIGNVEVGIIESIYIEVPLYKKIIYTQTVSNLMINMNKYFY